MINSPLSGSECYESVGNIVQPCPLVWIEIELVDEENHPVSGEKYRIELPDGQIMEGTLDFNGFARLDGIEKGTCKITFSNLDGDAWERI